MESSAKRTTACNGSICYVSSTDKFEAIHEVITKCAVFDALPARNHFEELVVARERLESTGIGRGVAIAHGKCDSFDGIRIGMGISSSGIPFDALDGKPVHLLFVIASTPKEQVAYLRALALIMSFVKQTDFREFFETHTDLDFPSYEKCDNFFQIMSAQDFS